MSEYNYSVWKKEREYKENAQTQIYYNFVVNIYVEIENKNELMLIIYLCI